MEQDMKRYFHKLMKMVSGLHAIIITDRDGVPIVRAANESAPELAMKPNFLATSCMALDQASKLGLEANKNIISMFGNYQVIVLNKLPLLVTMIADINANTGLILNLEDEMKTALQDITAVMNWS